MTLSEFVSEISIAHKGSDKNLAVGTDKWNRVVSVLNRKRREWARDPRVNWSSLFEERTVGTFSATQTVELDEDVNKLSDYVKVKRDENNWKLFTVVSPQRRAEYESAVYVSGNPKVLTFIDTIDADNEWIGSDLIVPCYIIPEDVTTASEDVLIDSPEWLIYATAAELARNDPAKDDQFGNLVGMANELYQQMKEANEVLPYGQPFDIPVGVTSRLGESW